MLAAISPAGGPTDAVNSTTATEAALARLQAAARPQASDAPSSAFESVLQNADLSTSPKGDIATDAKSANPYQRFESMVLSQLVSAMMNAGGKNVFGGGTAMSAYTSLFSQAIGDEIAARGGIGIADALARSRSPQPRSL